MCNTPMRSEQLIGVRDGVCGGGGGRTRRSIAGERGSGGARALDPQKLAPIDRTDRGVAHRGRGADGFCNTRFIKEHKPSNHIRARIKSHVYTTE